MTVQPQPARYSASFFAEINRESLTSAAEIVPLVLDLVHAKSVVDVGCGAGAWLSVFAQHGLDIFGYDGAWVDPEQLLIPGSRFSAVDLDLPLKTPRRYDLCVSLEVAEHLKPDSARTFIRSLAGTADCILFSAAAPCQEGTGHINCQWPYYWAELFDEAGYVWLDPFRGRMWNNPNVRWWFRQNMFLYCTRHYLAEHPELAGYRTTGNELMIVKPEILEAIIAERSHPKVVFRRALLSVLRKLLRQSNLVLAICALMA